MENVSIPTRSREVVGRRDRGLCVRCFALAQALHHRRSRRVADEHRHCPCNLVPLCHTCHTWVHANPREAREVGLIVSVHVTEPASVPVHDTYGLMSPSCPYGLMSPSCEGDWLPVKGDPHE